MYRVALILGIVFNVSPAFAFDFPNVTVEYCHDGDTCIFNIHGLHPIIGKCIRVRFDGVTAPEMNTKAGKKLMFRVTQKLAHAKHVELRNVSRDPKWFRLIGTVVADGVNVNQWMNAEIQNIRGK